MVINHLTQQGINPKIMIMLAKQARECQAKSPDGF